MALSAVAVVGEQKLRLSATAACSAQANAIHPANARFRRDIASVIVSTESTGLNLLACMRRQGLVYLSLV